MVRLFKLPQQFHVALVTTVLLLFCGSSFSLANNQKPQGSSNLEFGVVGSSGPASGGLKGSSTTSKIVHQQQSKNSGSNKSPQTFMDSLRTKSKLISNQNQNPNVKVASVSYGTILSKIAASGYSVATPSSTTKLDSSRHYGTNYGTLNNNNKKILLQKNHEEIFPDEILSQKLREYVESTKKEEDDKIKQQKKNQTSFSYSAYGGSTGGFEESENSEENLLGVETTSINPFELSETTEDTFGNTPAPILAVRSRTNSVQDQTKSRKQIEIEDDHNGLHQSKEDDGLSFLNAKRIKAAVQTKHTFEYRPVEFANLDRAEPKIIEVEAKSIPLEIHFKSASSRIKLVQSHQSGELNEIERTSSEEEPQRLLHLVRKPIIQEVHEIITPYRRIVQEIRPVMEEIRTVVSHEKESSRSDRFQSKTNEKLQQTQSANQTQVDRFQGQKLSPARQQKQLLAKQQQKQETVQKTPTQVVSKQTSQAARTTQRPSLAPVQEKRQQQQQRLEQKHIKDFGMKASHSNGYVPSYSFPLEGTGTTTTTTSSTKSTDFWDHQIDGADARSATDVDVDDQGTVEIIDNNGDSAIIPAKLMEDMIVSYQASIQSQKLRHQLRDQSVQLSQQQQNKNNQPKLVKNNINNNNNNNKQFEKQQLATTSSSNSDSASNFGWNYSGFRDFDSNNQQQRRNQQQLNQPQSAQSYGLFNQNNLYRSTNSNSNSNSNTNQNQQLQQSSSNQHWRVAPYNAHIEFNHFNHNQHPQQPNHNQFNHHHQQANQHFNHFNHQNNQHPNHQFNRY